jgi:protein-disulfide isomerase
VAIVGIALWAPGCFSQPELAVATNPAMTRGPATAPVTIVEFSDYQ